MAAMELKFLVVDAKPVGPTYEPFTIYLVKEPGKTKAQIYKSSKTGDSLAEFGDEIEAVKVLYTGDVKPEETGYRFWYHTDETKLFVNLSSTPETDVWVDAISVPAMPSFAGSGEAATMAHSDHWHEGTRVVNPAW